MAVIAKTLNALGNLTIILVIIIFVFAVIGMQLFGPKYRERKHLFPGKQVPRWNFVDFFHSFMIVFRVLCGEYMESMWGCMIVAGWPCIPFFLLTMVIGNLVALNIIMALLINSFGGDVLKEKDEEINNIREAFLRIQRFYLSSKSQVLSCWCTWRLCKRRIINLKKWCCKRNAKTQFVFGVYKSNETRNKINDIWYCPRSSTLSCDFELKRNFEKSQVQDMHYENIDGTSISNTTTRDLRIFCYHFPFSSRFFNIVWKRVFRCSLLKRCIWIWSLMRRYAFMLIDHRFFETFIISMICLSSITLAIEDVHARKNAKLIHAIHIIDRCFTYVFIGEMLLKWFAYGFYKYFSNVWNWIDFSIAMIGILGILATWFNMANVGAFKALRTLRALRPLRAMSRFEGIKVVINALFGAIPSIMNVLLVCLVFWLIFSIMGVQLFGGRFYKCVYKQTHIRVDDIRIQNKNDCLSMNHTWENSRINFDNVLNGYLALLQVATFKGWIDIMSDAVDARGHDLQPEFEHNVWMLCYFVVFIIFGSFFTLKLFIGVVIDNFNQQKKLLGGGSAQIFMTEEQKIYYNAMKKMGSRKPTKALPRPVCPIARLIFDVVSNQKFEIAIMIIILCNTAAMCTEHYRMSQKGNVFLNKLNVLFLTMFVAECVLKMIALNVHYFKDPWNVFDFLVVVASIAGEAMGEIVKKMIVNPTLLRIIRVARIGRVLRLVKGARGIRTLLFALFISLPALFNIGLLLFLVMFIYGILGMSFFGYVKYDAGINEIFNFETFFHSILVLFQMSTTAGWAEVLKALTNTGPPDCDPKIPTPSGRGNCGSLVAIPYLASYLVISSFVVINMYIAVILENYNQAQEEVLQGLTDDDYDMFYEVWQKYDPKGTQFISYDQLSIMVDDLQPPLKLSYPNRLKIIALDLPIYEGNCVFCGDLLDALTRNVLQAFDVEAPLEQRSYRPKERTVITTTFELQRKVYSAKIIVHAMRKYISNRKALNDSGSSTCALRLASIDSLNEVEKFL